MSYVIEVGDGNFQQTNRVPTFTAPARITVPTNYGANFNVGDVVKVTGAGVNDGIYTVAALITGTRIFDVAEAGITTAGAGGNCAWYQNESTTLQASTAISNFLVGSIIDAAGATFLTNNVRKGDSAFVLGAGTTLSGVYRITEVISETQIRVHGASKGKTTIGAAAGAGTVEVKGGAYKCVVTDEANPSWEGLRTTATGPDGSIGTSYITKGPVGDRITRFLTHGLRLIELVHTINATSTWVSERELVINDRADAGQGLIRFGSGATPGDLVRLGRAGGDRYGTGDFGSAWIGWAVQASATDPGPNDSLSCSMYGSYLLGTTTGAGQGNGSVIAGTGNQGDLIASMIDGMQLYAPGPAAATTGSVYTGTIESVISRTPGFAALLGGAPFSYDNFLVTAAGAAGVTINVTGFVQGLLTSVDVATPYFQTLNTFLAVLNPRRDYTLAELFGINSGEGYLDYTWAPRFVQPGAGEPLPVPGLTVHLFSINETDLTETDLGTFVTDGTGRIGPSGPGADLIGHGVDLRRGIADNAGDTLFTHRVVVEGPGIRRTDNYFTMRAAKINFDFPVDILRTDYEGEFST